MKICVFSDVHGNIEALNKLINSSDFQTADIKIFLGDAVVMGPHPNLCCKALLDNNCIWLMGNHDSYIANGLPEDKHFSQDKIAHQNYMRSTIDPEYKEIMENLPHQNIMNVGEKSFYFTHYMWDSWDDLAVNPDIPTQTHIETLFKNVYPQYIIYGHEHNPSHFKNNYKEYVCVGSLGMKYPGNYCMIQADENGIEITPKKLYYDVEKVKEDIYKAGYPRADKYIKFLN